MKKTESKNTEILVFRAPKASVKSVDTLAKLMGAKRSEVLRRLIPNISSKEGAMK